MNPMNFSPHKCLLLTVAIEIASFALVPSLHAQKVLPAYYGRENVLLQHRDSLRKDFLLVKNYDFACLYNPGVSKPDYGYSYSRKTHRLTLVECQTHFPWPDIRLNSDGTGMTDSAGHPVFVHSGKVKTFRYSLRLPDSLAYPLSELYGLAVKTARRDTCVSEEPPIWDMWSWSFFSSSMPYAGAVTYDPEFECPGDTSHNQGHFMTIHRAVVKAVRERNVSLIVKVMPLVRELTDEWKKLAEQGR